MEMRESVISLSLVEMHAPLSPSLTSKNRNESIDAHAFSALIPSLEHIKSELPCVQDYLAHCMIEKYTSEYFIILAPRKDVCNFALAVANL